MFTRLWTALKGLGKLLLPGVGKTAAKGKHAGVWRGVLHVLLVIVVLALLTFANYALDLWRYIPFAGSLQFLAYVWLPVLFFLVYVMVWVAWWLWKLLVGEEEASDYPDIDAAWNEAVRALNQRGIALADLPLFLVLGQSAGGDRALFQAGRIALKLDPTPTSDKAPLHVCASDQALFVTCPGLSLLAVQARNLAKGMDNEEYYRWTPLGSGEIPLSDPTLSPEAAASFALDVGRMAKEAEKAGKRLGELGEEERRTLYQREREDRPYLALRQRPDRLDDCLRRLQHLCRLIVRDRAPLCPANGILVLMPFAATASAQIAADTEHLCRIDLDSTRTGLRLLCPRVALLCDLELVPGFREFVAGFNREKRLSRMGAGCPLDPDFTSAITTQDPEKLVKDLAEWICLQNLPTFIYKECTLEDNPESLLACLEKNAQLFHLLDHLRERTRHVGSILARGLVMGSPQPLLFGGCYLAGTGSDNADQGFVRGVLDWLRDHQDDVLWTEEVRKQEAQYHFWASCCYTLFAILLPLSLIVVGYSLYHKLTR